MMVLASNTHSAKNRIHQIEVTTVCLADRGGLPLLLRHLDQTGLINRLEVVFSKYRHSTKGVSVPSRLRQVLAFLMDGTSFH